MAADGVATTTLTVTVEDANGNLHCRRGGELSAQRRRQYVWAPVDRHYQCRRACSRATLASTVAQAETITATEGGVHETTLGGLHGR